MRRVQVPQGTGRRDIGPALGRVSVEVGLHGQNDAGDDVWLVQPVIAFVNLHVGPAFAGGRGDQALEQLVAFVAVDAQMRLYMPKQVHHWPFSDSA